MIGNKMCISEYYFNSSVGFPVTMLKVSKKPFNNILVLSKRQLKKSLDNIIWKYPKGYAGFH